MVAEIHVDKKSKESIFGGDHLPKKGKVFLVTPTESHEFSSLSNL